LLLLGMDVPEMAILATEPRSADPDLGFRGNVDANQDLDNYGIHAKGLLKTLEALHTGSAVPRSVQGRLLRSLDEAKAALAQRQPVIVWIPLELLAAQRHDVPLPGGKVIHIVDHEHTVTLNGYDGDRFHALDPFDGSTPTYDAAALTQRMQLFDDPLLAIARTRG